MGGGATGSDGGEIRGDIQCVVNGLRFQKREGML